MRRYLLLILPPFLAVTMGLSGCPSTLPSPFSRDVPINLLSPQTGSLTLTFSANLGTFPDASSMNWDFDDGSFITNSSPATGQTVTHTFPNNGSFRVKVFVFNRQAMLGQGELGVVVRGPNRAPTASFTVTQVPTSQPGGGPRTFRFNAGNSSDVDGSIASFAWDFGDFSGAGSGQSIDHAYASSGRFTVRLTVTDDEGATGQTTQAVTANIPPTADFTFLSADTEAPGLLNVTFSGAASSDSDGSIATYSWAFGDETPAGNGAATQHSYGIQGSYEVTLTVTDNFGATGTKTQTLDLLGTRPFIRSITPKNGVVGTTVSITDLDGGNFVSGAAVRLTRSGQTDIQATSVNVVDSGQISCSFNLAGAQLGDWNVIVRNPDLNEATLTAGFRVVTADRVRLTTSMGDILLVLDPVRAPNHVTNFLKYVDAGKYDNIVFHRVPPNNFVIQSGAFKSLGAGANPRLEEIEGFPAINSEAPNGLSNIRGTVSLALRGQDANSGTNQFFINVGNNTNLDTGPPRFTVFGNVIEGLDTVVDDIAAVRTGSASVRLVNGTTTTFSDVPVNDVTIITARRE